MKNYDINPRWTVRDGLPEWSEHENSLQGIESEHNAFEDKISTEDSAIFQESSTRFSQTIFPRNDYQSAEGEGTLKNQNLIRDILEHRVIPSKL